MAKAKGEGTKIWSAFSLGAAIISAGVARKAIDKSWRISTGKTPPENPADPDVDVWEAVAWATVTGAAVALALLAALLLSYGSPRVSASDGWFRAGRAKIEAVHLGAVAALDAEETRRVAGPEADARAYLLLRPYLKRAVRVEITDPADPAPYWLVSSRHPDELARAVRALSDSSAV